VRKGRKRGEGGKERKARRCRRSTPPRAEGRSSTLQLAAATTPTQRLRSADRAAEGGRQARGAPVKEEEGGGTGRTHAAPRELGAHSTPSAPDPLEARANSRWAEAEAAAAEHRTRRGVDDLRGRRRMDELWSSSSPPSSIPLYFNVGSSPGIGTATCQAHERHDRVCAPLPLPEHPCPSITIATEASSICSSRKLQNDTTAVRVSSSWPPFAAPPTVDCRSSQSATTDVTKDSSSHGYRSTQCKRKQQLQS